MFKINKGGEIALSGHRSFEVTRGNKNGGDEGPKELRLRDIVKEAQRQDAAGDRKVVRLPPRRPIAAAVGGK